MLQISPLPLPPVTPERSPEAALFAIVAVVVLSILALVAAGLTFLRRLRRPDVASLQARAMAAMHGDVDCAHVDVVTTVGPSLAVPPSVTLEGIVPSAAARQRAVRLVEDAAREAHADVVVIDRLTVEARRRAA
jgi:hypothetical protein